MANIILLYEGNGASISLGGGDYEASLPITNLLTNDFSQVARTTSVDLVDTLAQVTLDADYYARAIVLGPGNFTPLMKYRIRTYSDAFTTLKYDSDWRYSEAGQADAPIKWGEPNFWVRGNTGKTHLIHVFDQPELARYWQIEIDDQTNDAGYLDIGRLFMPMGWQPSINYVVGGSQGWTANAQSQQMLGGGKVVRNLPRQRTFACQFDLLTEAEATLEAQRLIEAVGYSEPVFIIPAPDDSANMNRKSFFATITQPDPVTHLQVNYARTGLQLEEII